MFQDGTEWLRSGFSRLSPLDWAPVSSRGPDGTSAQWRHVRYADGRVRPSRGYLRRRSLSRAADAREFGHARVGAASAPPSAAADLLGPPPSWPSVRARPSPPVCAGQARRVRAAVVRVARTWAGRWLGGRTGSPRWRSSSTPLTGDLPRRPACVRGGRSQVVGVPRRAQATRRAWAKGRSCGWPSGSVRRRRTSSSATARRTRTMAGDLVEVGARDVPVTHGNADGSGAGADLG